MNRDRDRRDRDRDRDREHRDSHHRDRDSHHRDRDRDRDSHRERGRDHDRHNNNKPVTNSATLKAAIHDMVKLCIEEEAFYLGKETGRLMRWGELEALGALEEVPKELQVVDAPGVDIFGEPLAKKHNFECECPRCRRTLAAQRFAPHLEKCMGMGRNSSRIASKRLAQGSSSQSSQNGNGAASNSQGNEKPSSQGSSAAGTATSGGQTQNGELQSEEEHFEEDEDDEDWTMERKRKHTKKVTEKISPKRKGPVQRIKNAESSRGRRGASPSMTDSPLSFTSSLNDDDDFAALTLG